MMFRAHRVASALAVVALLLPLAAQSKNTADDSAESLRHYAGKLNFWIGTTIQGRFWDRDRDYKPALAQNFNAAVSIVFSGITQPERGRFNFDPMDDAMGFARQHDLKLMGHCLVYRNATTSPWLKFNTDKCGGWSARELDQILRDHIQTVVRHGGDTYYAWEVVNEPLNPTHNGCWSQILGEEDYMVKAFRYAREANPNALLLLNETFGHGGIDRERADPFFALVKRLKAAGAPIDAVGAENHWSLAELRPGYLDEFKYFLDRARKAGVKVHVTEMDVYQGAENGTSDVFGKQREVFYNVTHACLQDANCIGLTTWGIADRYARMGASEWNDSPAPKPVLFDDNFQKKPAYFGVLQALKEGR